MSGNAATIAPGSIVVVRDEEWLVTSSQQTDDGLLIHAQGLSELVRGTTAAFYDSLDSITPLDPSAAQLRADSSPRYRDARLWLEATLRKTPLPLSDERLTASTGALADPLAYQRAAVRKALSKESPRPRILLADAVGLGKTLEIGMILAELIRRGRGERILIVCPRHVLEQMQNELWSRFAIPFVRLDSVGVQRIKQQLPATRNPFTYFNRVIISMDTLKQERFAHDLSRQSWDAVVIDESHNVTNASTQNNRLARILAPTTDALILASATPHNGRAESFAELIRLLEPTAVTPSNELLPGEIERLVIRRHRGSAEVASVVGSDWAERKAPQHFLVPASPAENAVADELASVWLHPPAAASPYSGQVAALFPWTLAKAFLSSPAALRETVENRIRTLGTHPSPAQERERAALQRLDALNEATFASCSKYDRLAAYLRSIGVGPRSEERAVVFAERVPTLRYLQQRLTQDFRFKPEQVAILHGGLTDVEQQEIVESFKQATSPIRVLVTGDVASEGVNLHRQCHELIHFDIPWSLIRIEQRNGRIDRYGQTHPPQITTLLLNPARDDFSGDIRVLSKLLEREQQAHEALGDAASLMGEYSVAREEEAIMRVLAGQRELDDVVKTTDQVASDQASIAALLAAWGAAPTATAEPTDAPATGLYSDDAAFLREAMHAAYVDPYEQVRYREHPAESLVELCPPPDLRQRLQVLPDSYLRERRVADRLLLATSKQEGKRQLDAALRDASTSSWPEAHYLGPLHPVLDWAADQALAALSRNQVFVVRGRVDAPTMLLLGTLTNRRGQTVNATWVRVEFPNPELAHFALPDIVESPAEFFAAVGLDSAPVNPGACADVAQFQPLVPAAVESATNAVAAVMGDAAEDARARVAAWQERGERWQAQANELAQRLDVRQRRGTVAEEQKMLADMAPTQRLVRPLVLVLPADHPVAEEANHARE